MIPVAGIARNQTLRVKLLAKCLSFKASATVKLLWYLKQLLDKSLVCFGQHRKPFGIRKEDPIPGV